MTETVSIEHDRMRPAAILAAAILLSGCAGAKAANIAAPAPVATTHANVPIGARGKDAIALAPEQQKQLDETVRHAPAAVRRRLRYALAADENGKARLVVYDGQGLGADGRDPRRPKEFMMFAVLNGAKGEHYDPQGNAVISPIPPPVQRDSAVTER